MEKLRIYYRFKGNGIIFGSAASDYDLLKKNFPTAQPAKSVFVEYDIKSDFRKYHAQLENYIFPALAGFAKTQAVRLSYANTFLTRILSNFTNYTNYNDVLIRVICKIR